MRASSSYYGINKQAKEIKVHGLHYIIENANAGDSLLIVDDVFESGRSIFALKEKVSRVNAFKFTARYSRCVSVLQAKKFKSRYEA